MHLQITKIHTAGSDYLVCTEAVHDPAALAKRLLDRRCGVGADGLLLLSDSDNSDAALHLFLPSGREGKSSAAALIAAARFLYGEHAKNPIRLYLGETVYTVRLSILGGRVLCAWLDLPPIRAKPMEQLKYYYGIRGEVLRACIPNPRVSLFELCGSHAVFLLESPAALRALALRDVCTRLAEVLFYGEEIDLHFCALAGDNALAMRSWRCGEGEMTASGEGAVVSAYTATEYALCDAPRMMVKTLGGSFCVELYDKEASLCAKCETVFVGEAV